MGNPEPPAPLRACKSNSRDLAGINSTSLNICFLEPRTPPALVRRSGQGLQTVGVLQGKALGQYPVPCGGSLSDGSGLQKAFCPEKAQLVIPPGMKRPVKWLVD